MSALPLNSETGVDQLDEIREPNTLGLGSSLANQRIGVLVNTSSGGCDRGSIRTLISLLESAWLTPAHTWSGEAKGYQAALRVMSDSTLDVLIILGGDGTIRAAAEVCSRAGGPLLIPLPGGTMNLLTRALFGPRHWTEVLDAIVKKPVVRLVSGGKVGQHRFYVAASFGEVTRLGAAREALRNKSFATALAVSAATFGIEPHHALVFDFNERRGAADAVVVLCPMFQIHDPSPDKLQVATFTVSGPLSMARLTAWMMAGDWRHDSRIEASATQSVALSSASQIPAMLDGEVIALPSEVTIAFNPIALRILGPGT